MCVCTAYTQNVQELQVTPCCYLSYNPFQSTKDLPAENAKRTKQICLVSFS